MLTGYAAAKYINEKLNRLEDSDDFKQLPAQMFYTYYKKGMIETTISDDGKKVASVEVLDAWFDKYVEKKRANIAKRREAVEAELEGEAV